MDHRIQQIHQQVLLPKTKKAQEKSQANIAFKDVLTSAQSLKISKHAQTRLEERNIKIDDSKWQAVTKKVNEAKEKGITDSLVVMKEGTLVVSAKNNTVVTAMDREEAQARVFSNINGTILMD
ncbi:hypothetical protein Pryu01_00133 [Paraliobacillus ryukyuensis]|uniref:Flagellar operon protein n=1 Tax=Paraliobacillus ryukyuensis TaxID=200904 RepID=A0A366EK36_9BACI|nr:TIGR02530 family flagellar biosynthesis protein [Paraliobacillus ryukyuensis]RBP01795.1 flagellar operon protein [Paraliobacillus ryukyuensis]